MKSNKKIITEMLKITGSENANQLAKYLSGRYGVEVSRQQVAQFARSERMTITHMLLRECLHVIMGEPKEVSLDSILLSPNAVRKWHQHAASSAHKLAAGVEAVLDERAEELPSGELRLFVELPGERQDVEMIIPEGEWSYSQ